jgi:hypothetical protein
MLAILSQKMESSRRWTTSRSHTRWSAALTAPARRPYALHDGLPFMGRSFHIPTRRQVDNDAPWSTSV